MVITCGAWRRKPMAPPSLRYNARMLPEDLIDYAEAATIAERSQPTIRRWVSSGALTRYEGSQPEHGGSPRAYVSRGELLAHLIASGQQPRASQPPQVPDDHPSAIIKSDNKEINTPLTADNQVITQLKLELAAARAEADRAELAGELAATRAELAGVQALVVELRQQLASAHTDRGEWRERYDAARAEIEALRTVAGLPWYRRLLSGPLWRSSSEDPQ